MNKQVKTLLQLLVGIGIATALLYLTFRDRTVDDLVSSMREADPFWTMMGGLALLVMFIFRALRWKLMLDSSGHPAAAFNTILATLICYLVNSLTPRLGEIARCSVLLKTDKIPIPTALGTVVSERVIDTLVLFGGVGIIFLMEVDRLGGLFSGIMNNLFGATSSQSILAGVGIGLVGLLVAIFGYRYLKHNAESGIARKVYGFIHTMITGARSVFKLEKPWVFFFYTFMIWFLLVLMNYFFILALPDTESLGFYVAVLILFIGGIGWALPVPGGMGTTHYIILQLFVAFNLSETAGQNIGLLSNGATFVFTVIYGLIAWGLFMWIVFRRGVNPKPQAPDVT